MSALLPLAGRNVLSNFKVSCRFSRFLKAMSTVHSSVCDADTADIVRKKSREEEGNSLNPKIAVDTAAYTVITEGKAEVHFPNSNDVFYNPVQEFNRDLSIAVLSEFTKEHFAQCGAKATPAENVDNPGTTETGLAEAGISYENGVTILEALSASGLRSIRYALEVPGIKYVVANDMSFQAVEAITRNVQFNKVEHLVRPNEDDASLVLCKHRKYSDRFHVVDLDPYGSPTAFLDGAVQAIKDGGLLMVTCTDLAILCGNSCETCHAKYGSVSLRSKCCHEMALRIVLRSIESHANRYGRYIVPLLSVSVDFYVRIFVKVFTSQVKVKQSFSKLANVFQCTGCETLTLQRLGRCIPTGEKSFKYSPAVGTPVGSKCDHCGRNHHLGGPIWADPIHDTDFVKRVLKSVELRSNSFKTAKRITGVLNLILEELPDIPLYYSMDRLAGVVHTICPKMDVFRSAILNGGYRVSFSHAFRTSVKTDAPPEFIWDIFRHWAKLNPVKRVLSDDSPAKAILEKEPSFQVSFVVHPDANPESRKNRIMRFQENPEKCWGPKMRAKTSFRTETQHDKSTRLQGKRARTSLETDESGQLKQYACKRFRQGKCQLAENCRYSHAAESCIKDSETITD